MIRLRETLFSKLLCAEKRSSKSIYFFFSPFRYASWKISLPEKKILLENNFFFFFLIKLVLIFFSLLIFSHALTCDLFTKIFVLFRIKLSRTEYVAYKIRKFTFSKLMIIDNCKLYFNKVSSKEL